jgi:Glucoamylase and related glycosyl hydrolases
MEQEEEDMYRDSARILAGLHDPQTSSSPGAPNLQPLYYPTWIRDGAIQAVARAQSGQHEDAKNELSDFMAEVQSENGGFKQCFNSEGGLTGIWDAQNDQPSIFTWAVSEIYEETEDEEFLEEIWDSVRDAQEYLIDNRAGNGLLKSAPDYSEDPQDFSRQSLWTNSFAYESLMSAAELAEELGKDGSGRYRAEAENIGQSTIEQFFPEDGEPISEYRLFDGASSNFGGLESFMVWPLRFAEDYNVKDDITSILDDNMEFPPGFIPGQLNYAGMLYSEGRYQEADDLVNDVLDHRSEAGGLYERVKEDGERIMAYPLGWSQAAFIMAMDEKYSQSA